MNLVEKGDLMRVRKGLAAGLIVAMVLMGGVIAFAQKQEAKEPDPYQNLGLSTAQRTKLDAITSERKTALTASQQKIVGIRQKLLSLLFDKKAKDQEIDKLTDQLATADREALVAQIKFHKAMRQILTQEQLTTLNKGAK
jgi:Spy/CpxP family protein refolding chaperone